MLVGASSRKVSPGIPQHTICPTPFQSRMWASYSSYAFGDLISWRERNVVTRGVPCEAGLNCYQRASLIRKLVEMVMEKWQRQKVLLYPHTFHTPISSFDKETCRNQKELSWTTVLISWPWHVLKVYSRQTPLMHGSPVVFLPDHNSFYHLRFS